MLVSQVWNEEEEEQDIKTPTLTLSKHTPLSPSHSESGQGGCAHPPKPLDVFAPFRVCAWDPYTVDPRTGSQNGGLTEASEGDSVYPPVCNYLHLAHSPRGGQGFFRMNEKPDPKEEPPARKTLFGLKQKKQNPLGPPEELVRLDIYTQKVLGVSLHPKQAAVLRDLDPPGSRVVLRAANGSGKTSRIAAPAVLWNAMLYPGSLTITTSGVFRQVKEQMWPQIGELTRKFAGLGVDTQATSLRYEHRNGQVSKALGFSTDDGNKFEGWHNENLLMIVDEAKAVDDKIFESIERCQPNRLLVLSSPGGRKGGFARAFGKEADLWKKHVIRAEDCPHIKQSWVDFQIKKWGLTHPLVRSMIYAEFMDDIMEELIIYDSWLTRLWAAGRPPKKGNDRVAFCDFAAGGDENVMAWRNGSNVDGMICWRDTNTMAAVARFLREFNKLGLKPDQVYADAGGLGHVMCDALMESGFEVQRVLNNHPAFEDDKFSNRGSEMWFKGARKIEMGEVWIPEDEALKEQLTNRKAMDDGKGRLRAESKEMMAKRNVRSPDRADAVLGCIESGRWTEGIWDSGNELTRFMDMLDNPIDTENTLSLAGANCAGFMPGM